MPSLSSIVRLRPAEHLDPDAVGIEHEEGVAALLVPVLLGREVDIGARGEAARIYLVNLVRAIDREGGVLDADLVVMMGPPSAGRSPK
jgi:hypothetical protein